MSISCYSRGNMTDRYWGAKTIENSFPESEQTVSGQACALKKSGEENSLIDSLSILPEYLECALYNQLLYSELNRQYIVGRQVNILMKKTANVSCYRTLSPTICSTIVSTDSSNANKSDLSDGRYEWMKYSTAEDNKFTSPVVLS